MKQILQNFETGKTELTEVPCPEVSSGNLLVRSSSSLISAGTERMLVEFGKANLIQKAKSQPEKVQQVVQKVKTDGLMPTIEAVRSKLGQPIPLGYSNAGIVQECGSTIGSAFEPGTRVISNGAHAEYVSVPKNLCAKIPESVSNEAAACTVVASIGLQGIRLAQPTLGEVFVVTGLGLIGLLTVQILHAHGCRVIGIDTNSSRCELAKLFGAHIVDLSKGAEPVEVAHALTDGVGVDGVIITAATKSNEPIQQAARMCRKKGRIIQVGVTGLELSRDDFYKKELRFQVSCSYGPGRYDTEYEQNGNDYPLAYVRWTEQRNFEAILDLMARGKIDVAPLITHRFDFDNAEKAFEMIAENKESYLGVILNYNIPEEGSHIPVTVDLRTPAPSEKQQPVIGMVGAGNFTGLVLLPAIAKNDVRLVSIASKNGVTGTVLGKKFGFEQTTTDIDTIFQNPDIDTIFITTRHNTHGSFVARALEAGKNVFVEKPLCLNMDELDTIAAAMEKQKTASSENNTSLPLLMVGFNRRFSPYSVKIKKMLETVREPKSFIMTVNAGKVPPDHWMLDPKVGGGRILGEGCHFIDLLRFFAGSTITSWQKSVLETGARDSLTVSLTFADGSIGSIHYFANGTKEFPKERLDVFAGGKILQLNNFRSLIGYGWKKFKKMNTMRQDKGHAQEIASFCGAIRNGGAPPIPFGEIMEVSRVTIELAG